MPEVKPLPCPFCRNATDFDWKERTAPMPISQTQETLIQVYCLGCHATGSAHASEDAAICAWNLPARPKAQKEKK